MSRYLPSRYSFFTPITSFDHKNAKINKHTHVLICSKSYGQIQVFQCPCGSFTVEAFSAHFLRSKKPHKTKKRETQTSNRVSRCLSHFGLHSWGKQETSLNIQMIICGMLEISGILLENFYQAVGSPHTPQGKALELSPCTAVWQERGRPQQGPDCMQRRKNTPTTAGLHNPRQKKVFPHCTNHCKCHPLFFEN